MIPEYRLVRSLVNLHTNKEIKQAVKNKIKSIDYKKKKKVINFIFNVNENVVFNHVITLNAQFNNYQLDRYYGNIIDFNFLIAGLMPVFEFQKLSFKDYEEIQKVLEDCALMNSDINKWYQESQSIEGKKFINPDLNIFLKNELIPKTIKEKIIGLTHTSGKFFESLRNTNYQLGYYLMLFYLISLETKQTLIFKSDTNWNLKSYFLIEDFFSYKLMLVEKFSKILMENEGQNFNLYLRVINAFLNKNSD
ncbi:MAG: hypothetical protein REH79_00645 [Spiroplasma sp.]|nr:hypothetical protein [Spiroplasma sp.]